MKLLIASDIHGSLLGAKRLFAVFEKEKCDKILLLGDLLYHGPRNDLPEEYAPKEVIKLLNSYKNKIICVRGNCDTEVDQMVLDFPIMADYAYLVIDNVKIFATHGHKFNMDHLPPLDKEEILLHGHTHVIKSIAFGDGNIYLNPGSTSIPKEGNPPTYMIFENRTFTTYSFDGKILNETKV